jgi:hypothetical protein
MAKGEKWVEVEVRCADGSRCFVARPLSEVEQWQLRLVAERGNFAALGERADAAIFAELLMFGIDNLEGFLTMDDDDDDDDDDDAAAAA